jgi:hypothetical protein
VRRPELGNSAIAAKIQIVLVRQSAPGKGVVWLREADSVGRHKVRTWRKNHPILGADFELIVQTKISVLLGQINADDFGPEWRIAGANGKC